MDGSIHPVTFTSPPLAYSEAIFFSLGFLSLPTPHITPVLIKEEISQRNIHYRPPTFFFFLAPVSFAFVAPLLRFLCGLHKVCSHIMTRSNLFICPRESSACHVVSHTCSHRGPIFYVLRLCSSQHRLHLVLWGTALGLHTVLSKVSSPYHIISIAI